MKTDGRCKSIVTVQPLYGGTVTKYLKENDCNAK